LHSGETTAATALALMRSRFSAFAMGDAGYLLATWHPSTRPGRVDVDPVVEWRRLEVRSVEAGGPFDTRGFVEFRALYRTPGGRGQQHERSEFHRTDGRCFYLGPA
jgi:SEC-C motif-containing protein